MKFLADLLNTQDPFAKPKLAEGKNDRDLQELIDEYTQANRMYHFEGPRGVSNFDKIIRILGYRDMDEFLADNSGCLEAMLGWIGEQRNVEWVSAFEAELPGEGEND